MSSTPSAPEDLAPQAVNSREKYAPGVFVDAILFAGAVAVLIAAAVLGLGGPGQVVLPFSQWVLPGSCTFKVSMGVGCPGCGLTRCFIAMAHGDVPAAWNFNPVGIFMFAMVAMQVPYRGWKLWEASQGRARPYNSEMQTRATLWILGTLIVLLASQWIIRLLMGNVP